MNNASLRFWFCVLYGANMYFQSFGAVAVVKVNAPWFHVRERGGFGGIFGTMIASGIHPRGRTKRSQAIKVSDA